MKNRKVLIALSVVIVVVAVSTIIVLSNNSSDDKDEAVAATKAYVLDADVSDQLKEIAATKLEYIVSGGESITFNLMDEDWQATIKTPHTAEIHAVAVSPDRLTMVSGDKSGAVLFWNLADGTVTELLGAHKDDVKDIDFSPDGSFFTTAGKDRLVKIWDTQNLICKSILKGHKSYVLSTDISPDGTMIASVGMDNKLIVWDASTGEKIKDKGDSHYRAVNQVKFLPDGKRLATASTDTFIKIWDIETLTCLNTIKGHINEVLCIEISPDGKSIFSAGRDKVLYSFDINTGEMVSEVDMPNNLYSSGIRMSDDGKMIYTADKSGDLLLIDSCDFKILKEMKVEPATALGVF